MTGPIQALGRAAFAAALLGLAGCASGEIEGGQELPSDIPDAICEGEHEEAVRIFASAEEPIPKHPVNRLIAGYALEQSGRVMAARRVYDALERGQYDDPMTLRCDSSEEPVLSGAVADVAKERLAVLNADLANLGATERQIANIAVPDEPDCRLCRGPEPKTPFDPGKPPPPAPTAEELNPPPPPPPAPPPAPPTPPAPMLPEGVKLPQNPYWVQVAAYRKPMAAEKGWAKFNKWRPALFKNCSPAVVLADLGAKGTFYRLGCDGFEAKRDAGRFCGLIKRAGKSCMVRKGTDGAG